MTETRTLSARHETVHEGILAGPNATLQEMIDSGLAWRLEGHVGRAAMNALKIGAVVLPRRRAHRRLRQPRPELRGHPRRDRCARLGRQRRALRADLRRVGCGDGR